MTHDEQCTAFDSMIQLLADEGFEGMAEAIAILVNEAMKIERSEALNAEPRRKPLQSWSRRSAPRDLRAYRQLPRLRPPLGRATGFRSRLRLLACCLAAELGPHESRS